MIDTAIRYDIKEKIEETHLMENIIYTELKRDDMGITTMGIRQFLLDADSLNL